MNKTTGEPIPSRGALRSQVQFRNLSPSHPTPNHCDNLNDAASILSEEHVYHPRVKHIRVKYHYIRDLVEEGEKKVARVRSADNVADIMTKPLGRTDYLRLRKRLGLCAEESADRV